MNTWPSGLVVLQLPVALAGLLGAIFYPAAGRPTMLLGMDDRATARAIDWARDNGATLVGFSATRYDPVVLLPADASPFSALRAGFLPVSADIQTCGDQPSNPGISR